MREDLGGRPAPRPLTRRSFLTQLAAAGLLPASRALAADAPSANARMSGDYAPVHDPCIVKADGLYHLFSTGHAGDPKGLLPWRVSTDLLEWEYRGAVFEDVPDWAAAAVPGTRGLWAPDIARCDGEYRLYYSCSTFGSNHSVIGLVTNETLDPASPRFAWRDRGLVTRSTREDEFNAIDANHLEDRDGRHWLAFGSFWSGIKLLPLDRATGKPPPNAELHALAARPVPEGAPGAVEAPFLIARGGWYYLFVSYDYCCRGAASSYYIVVGRARDPVGPYVGRDGRPLLEGYGTVVLDGDRDFRGPGHNAVLRDGDRDWLVYHAYDARRDGIATLRISPITWTDDGWPTVTT